MRPCFSDNGVNSSRRSVWWGQFNSITNNCSIFGFRQGSGLDRMFYIWLFSSKCNVNRHHPSVLMGLNERSFIISDCCHDAFTSIGSSDTSAGSEVIDSYSFQISNWSFVATKPSFFIIYVFKLIESNLCFFVSAVTLLISMGIEQYSFLWTAIRMFSTVSNIHRTLVDSWFLS